MKGYGESRSGTERKKTPHDQTPLHNNGLELDTEQAKQHDKTTPQEVGQAAPQQRSDHRTRTDRTHGKTGEPDPEAQFASEI